MIKSKFTSLTFSYLCVATSYAAGPTGFDSINLGMNKESVEAIKSEGGMYVATSMKRSGNSPLGDVEFDTKIASSFSQDPLKAVLTFKDEQLISIFLDLAESEVAYHKIKQAFTDKYGEPKVSNSIKEAQCLYQNGNSSKISSGMDTYKWSDENATVGKVITTLTDLKVNACPAKLGGPTPSLKLLSVRIGVPLN